MIMKIHAISFLFCLFSINLNAQELTQTIRGTVFEEVSEFPLPGVSIYLLDTDPIIGTSSGIDGSFKIEGVPVGRYQCPDLLRRI